MTIEPPALPPTCRDVDPINAAMFDGEAALTMRRFEYLIQRRDALLGKLGFGLLALNGASLVALIGALSGGAESLGWLGFAKDTAKFSAAGFAAGAILSGAALVIEGNLQRTEAGDAFARQAAAGRLIALYNAKFSEESYRKIGETMDVYHALPLVDFQYSAKAIAFQNAAAGCWLFAVALPLWRAFAG